MDVMTPTDTINVRSASYANGGNIVGACSAVIRPATVGTVVEGEEEPPVAQGEGEPPLGEGEGEPPVLQGEGESPVDVTAAQQQLAQAFQQSDSNGDGKLSFEETAAVIPKLTQAVFCSLDTNGDGYISPAELGMSETNGCAGCQGTKTAWRDSVAVMLGLLGLTVTAGIKRW
jgi:hypothetical protein